MLNQIKNSFLCKWLQMVLIGYFLLSSVNISGNLGRIINESAEIHSIKGMTCNFLKKIFKCDGKPEELDETKESKTAKFAKGVVLLDYIIPAHTSLTNLYFSIGSDRKNYIDNPIFSFGFHGKIHLRPPQIVS